MMYNIYNASKLPFMMSRNTVLKEMRKALKKMWNLPGVLTLYQDTIECLLEPLAGYHQYQSV